MASVADIRARQIARDQGRILGEHPRPESFRHDGEWYECRRLTDGRRSGTITEFGFDTEADERIAVRYSDFAENTPPPALQTIVSFMGKDMTVKTRTLLGAHFELGLKINE